MQSSPKAMAVLNRHSLDSSPCNGSTRSCFVHSACEVMLFTHVYTYLHCIGKCVCICIIYIHTHTHVCMITIRGSPVPSSEDLVGVCGFGVESLGGWGGPGCRTCSKMSKCPRATASDRCPVRCRFNVFFVRQPAQARCLVNVRPNHIHFSSTEARPRAPES